MRIYDIGLLKFVQFKNGRGPKPRYRIHVLHSGVMLCFAVVNGCDSAEEVYRYEWEWLSALDYEAEDNKRLTE